PASSVHAVATANITDRDHRVVAFSANVSGGTPPYTYRWSFGDANSSMEANPNHTYSEGGRYPVQLIVEDSAANRAYSIVDVVLGGPPVITNVSISPNPTYVNQYTYFNAVGDDPDGSIVNWHWNFGDGSTWDASYSSAYHYYSALGTYNVTVTARGNDGLETSASRLVQVLDQPPYACFYISPNPTVVGYPTSFYDCSYDPDGYIASSSWDFGDGTNGTGSYVYHTFASAGSYLVRLTVVDNAGMTSFLNQTVSVNVNQLPVTRFSYSPSDPIAGQGIYFNGYASYDPDGYITYWTWDFGSVAVEVDSLARNRIGRGVAEAGDRQLVHVHRHGLVQERRHAGVVDDGQSHEVAPGRRERVVHITPGAVRPVSEVPRRGGDVAVRVVRAVPEGGRISDDGRVRADVE